MVGRENLCLSRNITIDSRQRGHRFAAERSNQPTQASCRTLEYKLRKLEHTITISSMVNCQIGASFIIQLIYELPSWVRGLGINGVPSHFAEVLTLMRHQPASKQYSQISKEAFRSVMRKDGK
jgi:hypothetical protein